MGETKLGNGLLLNKDGMMDVLKPLACKLEKKVLEQPDFVDLYKPEWSNALCEGRDAGAFECPDCNERFVPDMKAYIMGPHTITKRKLVCPHCGAHKYCKKVLTK